MEQLEREDAKRSPSLALGSEGVELRNGMAYGQPNLATAKHVLGSGRHAWDRPWSTAYGCRVFQLTTVCNVPVLAL